MKQRRCFFGIFFAYIIALPACNLFQPSVGFQIEVREGGLGTHCSGSLPAMGKLDEIGLSPEMLKAGIPCGSGDFDGNGILDYFLYNAVAESHGGRRHQGRVLVLFQGQNGNFVRSVLLGKKFSRTPEIYSKKADSTTADKRKAAGCPFPISNDGIVEPGTTSATYVFLWNAERLNFETYSCRGYPS